MKTVDKLNKFTLLLVISLWSTALWGQQARLSGKILGEGQEPLALAVVKVEQASDSSFVKGSVADEEGNFIVEGLAAGRYQLNISNIGYSSVLISAFELSKGESKELGTIQMSVNATDLEVVTVKSLRPVVEQKIDMTVLNLNNMITDGKNSIDVLRYGPGVVVGQEGEVSMNNKSQLTIMINGKAVRAEGQKLGTILRSIQANTIERIEVISNPSARYDAAGSGGIINIVLKRRSNLGTKYYFEQDFQYAANDRWRTSLTVNHRTENMHLHATGYYSIGSYDFLTDGFRIATIDNEQTYFLQDFDNDQYWRSPTGNIGADFYLGERATVGLGVVGFQSTSGSRQSNISDVGFVGGPVDSILTTNFFNPHERYYLLYNANYRYEDTTGQRFTFDFDLGDLNFQQLRNTNSIIQGVTTGNTVMDDRNLDQSNIISLYSSKVDWVKPFSDRFKMELGAKVSFVGVDHSLESLHRPNGAEEFRNDSLQSNEFFYDETILAGYTNLTWRYKKWGFQAGTRLEQTRIKGLSVDLFDNRIAEPDSVYLSIFPSAFITYDFTPEHKVRASYSRRINRPHYSDINPFSYFDNIYSFFRGNSSLGPDFTDSYELSYSYLDAATVSFAYSNTFNLRTYFIVQEDGVDIGSFKNAGNIERLNINISTPMPLADWWNGFVWIGPYAQIYDGEVGNAPLAYTQWGVNGFMMHNFSKDKWNFEISGWFNSRKQEIMEEFGTRGALNLSIGRRIMGDKGYLKLQLNDLLNTNFTNNMVDFNGVRSQHITFIEGRSFNINFSCNIGNDKVKDADYRSTASEEEKNRVNN